MAELRLDYTKIDPESVKPLYDIAIRVAAGTLEPALRDLVEVRVSQINGCSYCVDTQVPDEDYDSVKEHFSEKDIRVFLVGETGADTGGEVFAVIDPGLSKVLTSI